MQAINYLASIPWSERWSIFVNDGIQTAILGIITVFAVLSIIWGCLEALRYVFYTLPEQRKNAEDDDKVQESIAPVQTYSDDKAIVAAIIAAITAAREEEGVPPTVPFRVVSFRKKK